MLVSNLWLMKVDHGKLGIIAGILFVLWSVFEPARLTLGYSGNLRERVLL